MKLCIRNGRKSINVQKSIDVQNTTEKTFPQLNFKTKS